VRRLDGCGPARPWLSARDPFPDHRMSRTNTRTPVWHICMCCAASSHTRARAGVLLIGTMPTTRCLHLLYARLELAQRSPRYMSHAPLQQSADSYREALRRAAEAARPRRLVHKPEFHLVSLRKGARFDAMQVAPTSCWRLLRPSVARSRSRSLSTCTCVCMFAAASFPFHQW
jgi:hypothetical protein